MSTTLTISNSETLYEVVADLSFQYEFVAILSGGLEILFRQEVDALLTNSNVSYLLTLLIPWLPPPVSGIRQDGEVEAFLCSKSLLLTFLETGSFESKKHMVFALTKFFVARATNLDYFSIFQLGKQEVDNQIPSKWNSDDAALTVIVPHRGKPEHLHSALISIEAQRGNPPVEIRACLDQSLMPCYISLMAQHPNASFYEAVPYPVGPYVIRQHMLTQTDAQYIVMQDSDDFSCSDRISRSLSAIWSDQLDAVGCHELRLDEISRQLIVCRFPRHLKGALESKSQGGMLYPTLVLNRKSLIEAGGFSTNLSFACDTQFKLRGYFLLEMNNLDAFLYLRRRHSEALTVHPETRLGSPPREGLRQLWENDFKLLRSGKLNLRSSTLAAKYRKRPYLIRPVDFSNPNIQMFGAKFESSNPKLIEPDRLFHISFDVSNACRAGGEMGKPMEDSIRIDASIPMICVADGVTRTRRRKEEPKHSPAKIAADLATDAVYETTQTFFQAKASTIGSLDDLLPSAFSKANQEIANYAITLPECDFWENDRPGTVMTAAFANNEFLYFGHIGDSRLMVRNQENNFLSLTTDHLSMVNAWAQFNENRMNPRARLLKSRSEFRNNPHSWAAYGVLTGESKALSFVDYGRVNLANIYQAIVISDGLAALFDLVAVSEEIRNGVCTILDSGRLIEILEWAATLDKKNRTRQDDKSIAVLNLRLDRKDR